MVAEEAAVNAQIPLVLNLPPVPNQYGLFWCCADCLPISGGRMSLSWQPPDYKVGRCWYCKRDWQFSSRYGEDELRAEIGT